MRFINKQRVHRQNKFAKTFVIIFLILIIGGILLISVQRNGLGQIFGNDKSFKLKKEDILENNITSNFHENKNYKYQYRTGTTGNYDYNYDVEGTDDSGNDVSGNIDMQGKNGSGTIENGDGDEVDIDVDWNGYGILEATDDDGNTYELHVIKD